MSKSRWILLATAVALTGSCNAENGATNDGAPGQPSEQIDSILRQVTELSHQRTTPDQAVNSFFSAGNLMDKYNCYVAESQRQLPLFRTRELADVSNSFFSGTAQESRQRYTYNLERCLREITRYSVDIRNVAMETATHATVIVNVKNNTPAPADARPPDEYETRRRRDGETYKFQLGKTGSGWTITQVYSNMPISGEDHWYEQYQAGSYYPSVVILPSLR